MLRIILLLLVCFFWSCKKNIPDNTENNQTKKDSLVVSKIDVQKINFTEYVLDPKSEKQLNWLKYYEMQNVVEELKKGELGHFRTDKKIVETLMTEFTNTLPLYLNEESIQARILIVKTMYLKLNNVINMSTSEVTEIENAIQNLLESFSNLNYQINKKFERDSQSATKPK